MFPIRFLGYEVGVQKSDEDFWRHFYIPEDNLKDPNKFRLWLREAHLKPRWTIACNKKPWSAMIDACLGKEYHGLNFVNSFPI